MRRVICVLVLAALASGSAGAQSSTGESRARAKACGECGRDSALRVMQLYRVRHREDAERLSKLARELGAVRRALDADRELSPARRRRLEQRAGALESQLAEIGTGLGLGVAARALEGVGPAVAEAQRAMAAAFAEAAMPAEAVRFSGWMGITLDAPSAVEARGGDVYWRFFDHPEIVSVDPSSPAERAGIRQGDVLLAYNGQDVRGQIAMNRLLQPGRTVHVRVRTRRENRVRDVPVKVTAAHDHLVPRERAWHVAPPSKPRSPSREGEPWIVVTPEPGKPAVFGAAGAARTFILPRFNGIGGAHMETITRGLGEAIGVERGVLVISVLPGGPAYESGLLDGDVIVQADGREVHNVGDLRRLVMGSDERSVKLDVSRRGKTRQVMLRW